MLANVGIPMIAVQWPFMVFALVPVIIIEAMLIRRWLPISCRDAFVGITKANLFSTAIGVPLAWAIMLGVEFAIGLPVAMAAQRWHLKSPLLDVFQFLLGVAWLGPMERDDQWLIPVAVSLLLIPCFYLSVWLERWICIGSWSSISPTKVRRAVCLTNLASYAVLFVIACVWMLTKYLTRS